MKISFSYFQN